MEEQLRQISDFAWHSTNKSGQMHICVLSWRFKEPKQVSFADSEATEPAPVSYYGVSSQASEETRDESSPTLLRKFINLFWLKKDCFQLAIKKPKMETEKGV